jgi:hypothetical protein
MSKIRSDGREERIWKLREASPGSFKKPFAVSNNDAVVQRHFCFCVYADSTDLIIVSSALGSFALPLQFVSPTADRRQ